MKRLLGKRGEHSYNPQEVLYLIGNINYCYLHMLNGEVIMSCRTLKWFVNQWPHFLRVHKKALINQTYISFYRPGNNSKTTSYIVMVDNAQLEIARRRLLGVRQLLNQIQVAG
ncbi:LytTR family transcriptional regulator [Spirosoma sp. HMF4905]|uniref:LytTR family transcriptional regulator n=1 Tax=Spirosoma arboris TaxID=2682092 RepID=A0A7K1SFA7_9BACT|nr:LytTR family DNA-binding domain-containing protein [Spirosoma arboris]MVM32499.1 LytTR family transcriptional regulator [Spirosoma arboris]